MKIATRGREGGLKPSKEAFGEEVINRIVNNPRILLIR